MWSFISIATNMRGSRRMGPNLPLDEKCVSHTMHCLRFRLRTWIRVLLQLEMILYQGWWKAASIFIISIVSLCLFSPHNHARLFGNWLLIQLQGRCKRTGLTWIIMMCWSEYKNVTALLLPVTTIKLG
jgi:hypothetical protein